MYIALLILGIILTVWFFVNQERTRKKLQKKAEDQGTFHQSSTTQGGSNYGQGSSYLGPSSYKQGAEKTDGSDYRNEAGKLSETDKTDHHS